MNPTAIYSKSGKGVQEASGKTSLLKRPDRAVLSAIDGRANLQEVAQKCGKQFDAAFQALITQLDKDGFIREVSAGAAPAAPPKPAAAKPAAKPAAKAADDGGFGDLDFSSLGGAPSRPAPSGPPSRPAAAPPPKPAAAPPAPPPKQQVDALAKAREEAEAKAQAERERVRKEAEEKTRAELEAKLRAEAEKKLKEDTDAAAKAKAEAAAAEAKAKAAREAALKAAEAKLRAEQEAKAKLEAERKAREETEKRLEAERKAREEAEKKAKEEAERARKEAEEKARKEQEELRQRLEAERKAREEAERKAKEEAERVRRELEEERKRLEAERKKEEEERAARLKREEEEAQARRKKREEEEAAEEAEREAKRRKREQEEAERERVEEELRAEEARKKAAAQAAPAPKAEAKKAGFADSLLADLDSFTNREDEEAKAKAEEERAKKAEAERRQREEAERQAKEAEERQRREQEEARRKEEELRRARQEEEQRAQEEERRKREADEIRRKAEAATAAAMAKEGKTAAKADDIPISDDDLGMDEVKKERAALARSRPKEEEAPPPPKPIKKKEVEEAPVRARRPGNWGKRITLTLVLLAIVGVGVLHVMPLSTAEYERAATEALGRPVKIGSAKMWLITGPQVRLEDVTVGDAKISLVTASIGSAFGERKDLGTVELDGLTLPQHALGEAIFANVRGENFRVERIIVKSLQLPGPAVLPKSLQADIQLDGKGALRSANVRGPDGLFARLTPKDSSIEFDVIAAGFTLPIAPEITLSKFAMKGTATPRGMAIPEWGGAIFNGGISGTANVRWGGTWSVDGVVTVRGINAAVFAPALLSGGTGEGTGKFSMSGADPAKLASAGRLDGNFTVTQGTLGSFDLARAIQSNGKNVSGTTQFTEMNGQATYDRGAVALRNVTIGAGALNAGASADIASSGALSGRIVADVKAASQTRSATLLLGGTVKEPQVRN